MSSWLINMRPTFLSPSPFPEIPVHVQNRHDTRNVGYMSLNWPPMSLLPIQSMAMSLCLAVLAQGRDSLRFGQAGPDSHNPSCLSSQQSGSNEQRVSLCILSLGQGELLHPFLGLRHIQPARSLERDRQTSQASTGRTEVVDDHLEALNQTPALTGQREHTPTARHGRLPQYGMQKWYLIRRQEASVGYVKAAFLCSTL